MKIFEGKSLSVKVDELSQISEARREGAKIAKDLGLGETQISHLSILITELASNIVRHAHNGEIIFRGLAHDKNRGVEVLALDKGPGMVETQKCLEDGYSTAGSPGTGLGSIRRFSTLFDIFSVPGQGTAVLAQLWASALDGKPPAIYQAGVVCVPKDGETDCGDAWSVRNDVNPSRLLLADGLGHGILAAEAAEESLRIFHEDKVPELGTIMQNMHAALQKTRGAAVAIMQFDSSRQGMNYLGIGNIAGVIINDAGTRNLVSWNGIVGHIMPKTMQTMQYPWLPDALLVLYSDGLASRWKLTDYPGLQTRHPSLIAGVLYRDHKRGRDDVTVFVKRNKT